MKTRLFYSWQSDRPKDTNLSFIQEAAAVALSRIQTEAEFNLDPALDRDTDGMPGSPMIAESILEKINLCGLFLADVTLINEIGARRSTPNPNVLLELGYAVARVGWERIICVMNEEYGGPSRLPFDLQHRRWPIRYRLSASSAEEKRAEQRHHLSNAIELAVRTALQSGVLIKRINPKDRRAALRFLGAVNQFLSHVSNYFCAASGEYLLKVFHEDQPDLPGGTHPDPAAVQPIVMFLTENTLKQPSTVQQGNRTLTWLEVFAGSVHALASECDKLLDQFSERDDSLVVMIDEVRVRTENLNMVFAVALTTHLTELYDHGVPAVHVDLFRHFFLSVIKAQRIARGFTT